jgi:hypothetical protein
MPDVDVKHLASGCALRVPTNTGCSGAARAEHKKKQNHYTLLIRNRCSGGGPGAGRQGGHMSQ